MIYAQTNMHTLPTFDINLGSLALAAPEPRDFVELIPSPRWQLLHKQMNTGTSTALTASTQ